MSYRQAVHGEFGNSSPNGQRRTVLRSVTNRIRSHSCARVMVVMDVFTRRLVGFGVDRANIDGVSVCRMFNHAVAGQRMPKHVSTDHDPLFRFHRWLANLRELEIEEVKSVPCVPVSHYMG